MNKPTEKELRDAAKNIRTWLFYLEKRISEFKKQKAQFNPDLTSLQDNLKAAYNDISNSLDIISQLDDI